MEDPRRKRGFWERHKTLHGFSTVLIIVILFLLSVVTILLGTWQPWILGVLEICNHLPIPHLFFGEGFIRWVCRGMCTYFDHEIKYEMPKESYQFNEKQYIKCLSPHGTLPASIGCLWGEDEEWDAFGFHSNVLATSFQIHVLPFLKQFARGCNSIPSQYDQMQQCLHDGNSLILYPGGFRELFACTHKKEKLVIKKRKGLFRLALTYGVSLLPIYTFGMTELYERSGVSLTVPYYFNNDEDSIAYFWGRWWTPFPMKKKLLTVVGKPLHVVQKNEPTDEDIALLRNRYIEAVTELFHKWKAKYSLLWRDRNLVIS